ncbi:MAG TPA: hypothetical protein VIJ34_10305 [Acidimicrobiales bacterium]
MKIQIASFMLANGAEIYVEDNRSSIAAQLARTVTSLVTGADPANDYGPRVLLRDASGATRSPFSVSGQEEAVRVAKRLAAEFEELGADECGNRYQVPKGWLIAP